MPKFPFTDQSLKPDAGPLDPRHGECDYCGTKGCYPYRHERLGNEHQALRLARIMAKDHTETPRAQQLAQWVVAELTARKKGAKVKSC